MRFRGVVLGAAALVAGCQQQREPLVAEAWMRLGGVPGAPAAVYATLTGGAEDTHLLVVETPVAVRTELHETQVNTTGAGTRTPMTMRMVPLDKLELQARATVKLAPGGYHVMLFDVAPTVRPGGTAPIQFTFADGTRVEVLAAVVGAGDPPPK